MVPWPTEASICGVSGCVPGNWEGCSFPLFSPQADPTPVTPILAQAFWVRAFLWTVVIGSSPDGEDTRGKPQERPRVGG